jgi:hypothetical protein
MRRGGYIDIDSKNSHVKNFSEKVSEILNILSDIDNTKFARSIISTASRIFPIISGNTNFSDIVSGRKGGTINPDLKSNTLNYFNQKLGEVLGVLSDVSDIKFGRTILSAVNRLFPSVSANKEIIHNPEESKEVTTKMKPKKKILKEDKFEAIIDTGLDNDSALSNHDDSPIFSDEQEQKFSEIWNINAKNFGFSPELVPDYNPFKIYNLKEVRKIKTDNTKLLSKYFDEPGSGSEDSDGFRRFLVRNNIIKPISRNKMIELYNKAVKNNFYAAGHFIY